MNSTIKACEIKRGARVAPDKVNLQHYLSSLTKLEQAKALLIHSQQVSDKRASMVAIDFVAVANKEIIQRQSLLGEVATNE